MLFHDSLFFRARTRPHAEFMEDHESRLTYGEAAHLARKMANGLSRQGVGPGDRVALLSRNSARLFLSFHAASLIGAVAVPLNFRLAAAEWTLVLKDSDSVAVVAEQEFHNALRKLVGFAPLLKSTLSYGLGDDLWAGLEEWTAGMSEPSAHQCRADDPVYQMYTSGTTGRPKGVVVTHGNFAANIAQAACMFEERPRTGETALVVTPLYHCAGVWICSFACFFGMSILLHRNFEVASVVNDLATRGVSFTFLVPAMIQRILLETPDIRDRDWSRLHTIMYGASPIAEETLRQAVDVFACAFYQAYGLTETTGLLTLLGADDHRRALAGERGLLLAAGQALPGTELAILDASGREVAVGEVGEICARGPQIVAGYYNLADETADAMSGGWFHTGDAAVADADGHVYIRDRLKDMVVSGGENIYPREVENVLFEHPEIADAAVIGIPDERYGESLMAFVVPRAGRTPAADSLIAFCRARLAGYKIPRRIEFRNDLPRNATGKVLKTELRSPYWAGRSRAVG